MKVCVSLDGPQCVSQSSVKQFWRLMKNEQSLVTKSCIMYGVYLEKIISMLELKYLQASYEKALYAVEDY